MQSRASGLPDVLSADKDFLVGYRFPVTHSSGIPKSSCFKSAFLERSLYPKSEKIQRSVQNEA